MIKSEIGLKILTADWILPVVSGPVRHGAVIIENGRIIDAGERDRILSTHRAPVHDFGEAVIVPAWVNAHTHLELSFLSSDRLPTGSFVDWVREVVRLSSREENPERRAQAVRYAVSEMENSGTVLAGDITNGSLLLNPVAGMKLDREVFFELLGFQEERAEQLLVKALEEKKRLNPRARITAHAVYSVSPGLLKAINALGEQLSIHIAETVEESRFIKYGDGPMKTFLEERGVWDAAWTVPGTTPLHYLAGSGLVREGTLLVHCVHTDEADLQIIKRNGAVVCLCPRSNEQLKTGRAPVQKMLDAGIPVCVGTDSRASSPDLDVSNELKFLAEQYHVEDNGALIRMATLNGAKGLGRDADYGSLEPGKRACLNVFTGSTEDPEAFVVHKLWSRLIRV